MRLVTYDIKEAVATEKMNDDAFEIWIGIKNPNKFKAAPAAFYSRHGIEVGDRYVYHCFLDTETGEVLFINCSPVLHKAMVLHSLYPEFILNGLNRTE